MTDILARQRQLIGTTAIWALNDLIIGDGEYALERTVSGDVRVKVGNGVDVYSDLPFIGTSWGATAWAAQSRALDTEYHNTLDWPICVAAWGTINGIGSLWTLYASASSGSGFIAIDLNASSEAGSYEAVVRGIIPQGWYYKITATGSSPVLHAWQELR